MPVYEFYCEDCEKKFEVVATLQEKEAGLNPICPICGGSQVHQVFGRFTLIGGSKEDIDTDLPDIDEGEDYGPDNGEGLEDEDLGDIDETSEEDLELD